MDISEAIFHVRNGSCARRVGSDYSLIWAAEPAAYVGPYHLIMDGFIVAFSNTGLRFGKVFPWIPNSDDLLADDYEIFDFAGEPSEQPSEEAQKYD